MRPFLMDLFILPGPVSKNEIAGKSQLFLTVFMYIVLEDWG